MALLKSEILFPAALYINIKTLVTIFVFCGLRFLESSPVYHVFWMTVCFLLFLFVFAEGGVNVFVWCLFIYFLFWLVAKPKWKPHFTRTSNVS